MMRHKHLLFVPILVISLVTLSHNLHGQDVWRRIDLPEEYRNYILGGIAAKSLMEMVVIARTEPYGGMMFLIVFYTRPTVGLTGPPLKYGVVRIRISHRVYGT